jgi:general secretion pathway protein D
MTPIGTAQVNPDVTKNDLIIRETASNMGVLLELIKELDKKPSQVLIESTIIEVDSEKDLNVGINWSANKNSGDPTFGGSFNNPPVNAQGFPGSFTFGTIKSGLNISANLQALETHKKGKIISRPRIATASGVPAEINTIENVVIATTTQTVGLGGVIQIVTTFTTLPLPIDLRVTPRITEDGRITTVVNASITSQTGPAQGAGAPPPTSIQTATTTITTKNGETIVIGGLVRELSQDIVNGIPLLSSLPIIGTLFQEREKTNRKVELIIFITPTILED